MNLEQKAKQMRHAIDMMESAMMGWDALLDLSEYGALDDDDDADMELKIKVTWGCLRHVLGALSELTRIITSDEYLLREPKEFQAR